MSIKAFHIFFIVLSILLCAACAVWSFGNGVAPAFGWSCVAAGVAMIVYGIWFIRKARKIIV